MVSNYGGSDDSKPNGRTWSSGLTENLDPLVILKEVLGESTSSSDASGRMIILFSGSHSLWPSPSPTLDRCVEYRLML